jgi:cellulose synthase/poly-beta-1,6-N-acetylglucosamine synthase-like glycosyltransferase
MASQPKPNKQARQVLSQKSAELGSAISEHFRSIDSAPKGYASNRPASIANGFYITFTTISLILLSSLVVISHQWAALPHYDLIFVSAADTVARVPIRLFFVIFFLTYSLYAYTNWPKRAYLAVSLVGKFILISLLIDLLAIFLAQQGWYSPPMFFQQALSGIGAMVVFPHTVLRQAQLPPTNIAAVKSTLPIADYLMLITVTLACIALALALEYRYFHEIHWMRSMALLGGIGPGVFLVQQLFSITFASMGALRYKTGRKAHFAPPLAILVPAHNEAHSIAHTIHAVDAAAKTYEGQIRIYIVDNCSRDETSAVSQKAIDECQHIKGVVLYCGEPGKAIALNFGMDQIAEEFIVRIDADTVIGPNCLAIAMKHFADPEVGTVGGVPLPMEKTGLIPKARLVEVLLRHGFFQVALGGFNGILGVPGMFAVYRHSAVREIGGTTEGMNGEDTDIVLRMNAAGYKVVSDPTAIFYSETPASIAHLREQRLRWFRSIYHISAHNRHLLFHPRLITGSVVLPFMLMSAARRAMLAPLIIYCLLVWALFQDTYVHLYVQAALAMIFGMPMLMAVFVCLLWRRFDALLNIPLYLAFRVLRSYYTLASALTLIYPPILRSEKVAVSKTEDAIMEGEASHNAA